jgi:hypothetical protein
VRYADRYLGLGATEARRFGHPYIASEHVPLATSRDPVGTAATTLERLGLTAGMLDGQIRRRPVSPKLPGAGRGDSA